MKLSLSESLIDDPDKFVDVAICREWKGPYHHTVQHYTETPNINFSTTEASDFIKELWSSIIRRATMGCCHLVTLPEPAQTKVNNDKPLVILI